MYHRNPVLNLIIWILSGFGSWGSKFKHENNILRQTHADIINAVADKEKLKLDIEQLKVQLLTQKQEQELALNRERASWQVQRDSDKAKFDLEREQAKMREKFSVEEAIKRAQLAADESLTMKKLDYEQQIRQAQLDKDKALLSVKEEYAKKETQLHQSLHKEMYEKLNQALIQMSQEGDKNTRFVHDLMMKIFDKAPALNSFELTQRQYQGGDVKNLPKPIEVETV